MAAIISTFCGVAQPSTSTNRFLLGKAGRIHTSCMEKMNTPKIRKTETERSAEGVLSGQRIRAARDAKGWSLTQLSQATGGALAPSRVNNYEKGIREAGIYEAKLLARALEVPAAYLLGLVDETDALLLGMAPNWKRGALALAGITSEDLTRDPLGISYRDEVPGPAQGATVEVVTRATPPATMDASRGGVATWGKPSRARKQRQ